MPVCKGKAHIEGVVHERGRKTTQFPEHRGSPQSPGQGADRPPQQRREGTSAWVLTAQRLLDGRVVYLASSGWSERLDEASIIAPAEERAVLEAVAARHAAGVVDPVWIEVRLEEGDRIPVRLRERIRALGPSVHPEFRRSPRPDGGSHVPL